MLFIIIHIDTDIFNAQTGKRNLVLKRVAKVLYIAVRVQNINLYT